MPHTNNKKSRARTQNRSGRRALDSTFGLSNGSSASSPARGGSGQGRTHHAFTLLDEARNTEQHQSWDSDQRLRDSKVKFVSAGILDPTIPPKNPPELDDPSPSLARMVLGASGEHINDEGEASVEAYEEGDKEEEPEAPIQTMTEGCHHPAQEQDFYFVDSQGGLPAQTGMSPPRVPSPVPSDSSEEVILFAGRDQNGRPLSKPRQEPRTISDPVDARIKEVEKQIHEQGGVLKRGPYQESEPAVTEPIHDRTETPSAEFELFLHGNGGRTNPAAHRGRQNTKQTQEDALITDYIANMDSEHAVLETFHRRDLGGTEHGVWQEETDLSSGEVQPGRNYSPWDQDYNNDFDDLSTSDGVMGHVKTILSKRRRAAGLQYLVVWEDQSLDEARWVPKTTLSSTNALLQIEKFETEEKMVAEFVDNGEEDSDKDSDDTDDDEDNLEVDRELVPRRLTQISDEQVARLLAKQEELGIDVDDLLLFDGECDEGEGGLASAWSALHDSRCEPKRKGKAPNSRQHRGDPSYASPFADAYDGFDIMDFEGPTIKGKSKGRKANLVFDLSDSDLAESMKNAYENDRVRKKERKQAREELRAQGLLGSKSRKPDMKQKYKEGMKMTEIREEIKLFLISDNTTLALPPMEKEERKIVHGLANAFKLKSKSDGSGKKRFPILYKTTRTLNFFHGANTFDGIAAKVSRQFLPRPDVKHSGDRKTARASRSTAVSYRDGDVVGGSAPELGVDNRGRAILEKMGWSTGTALGALNNKGIMLPVTHIVKTTKAGLG